MNTLERKIMQHAQLYYEGNPIISDSEFDSLVEQLKKEKPDSEILTMTGWGYDPFKFKYKTKVNHRYQECNSIPRKPRVIEDIPMDFYSSSTLRISAKLDGLSGVEYWKDGHIFQALTRGNGKVGIDVTNKHLIITDHHCMPVIPGFTGAIRGEYVISNENWKKILEIHKDDENPPKNQRNYAAGLINRDEVSEELQYVDFVPYKILAWEGNDGYIDIRRITNALNDVRLNIVDHVFISNRLLNYYGYNFLKELYKKFNEKYPCDGCVITKNNVSILNHNTFVYDEVAFKFDAEALETKVKHIEFNMTRTNKLFPVLIIEPLDIDGSTINRVSGFNAEFIVKHKITEGTEVKIHKGGMVIPDISEVKVDGNWVKI